MISRRLVKILLPHWPLTVIKSPWVMTGPSRNVYLPEYCHILSQSHKFCNVQLQKLTKSTPKKVIRRWRGVSKAKIFKEKLSS